MAFDMQIGDERAYIDHHEEGIFEIISDDDRYPQLNRIWEKFYDGPRIMPNIANALVHELIMLREQIVGNKAQKHLLATIDRIMPFFSRAYTNEQEIKCWSD